MSNRNYAFCARSDYPTRQVHIAFNYMDPVTGKTEMDEDPLTYVSPDWTNLSESEFNEVANSLIKQIKEHADRVTATKH